MSEHAVALVGTGIDPEDPGPEGFGMAYRHADAYEAIESDRASESRAENALTATEIIFGYWESSRRHNRVDFPLSIEDNPLEAMVASGDLQPAPLPDDEQFSRDVS